jgi:hypothetical protein
MKNVNQYAAAELDDGDVDLRLTDIPEREFDGTLARFEELLAGEARGSN